MSDPRARASTDTRDPLPSSGERPEQISAVRPVLDLPEVIDGRYRIDGRLGAGSMGVVLRGEDVFLQRPVAIKVVDPPRDPGSRTLVLERFVKEAQALARLRHENVVQVYAFGPLGASHYLAMELVAGQSLETVIDELGRAGTTLPLPRAMQILRAIARGLEAVHAQGLIHRDVKPANILVERTSDRPVLIDFGLALRQSGSTPHLSITGGTPSYMAPEQARDPDGSAVTHRTDLYALGCTAFEVLTGRPVFEGEDVYAVLLAHASETPRLLSSVRPDLAPFDPVIARALAKDPAERWPSASEMIGALDDAARRAAALRPRRLLVLAADTSLRRSLARRTAAALDVLGVRVETEAAVSASEAISLIVHEPCDVCVIDEESAAGRLGEIVDRLREAAPGAQVVVVARDLRAAQRAAAPHVLRYLVPKPVNAHVLAAVLARLELP